MNPKVKKLFNHLQDNHARLLAELDKTDARILERSPRERKWSVTQIMYHLNSAESNSVLYVSKKRLGAAQLRPTGLEAQLRLLVAIVAFYLPIKFKAPSVLGDMPAQVSYPEIKTRWIETRKKLESLLESHPEDELRKPIFRQPTFGYWNIFQMLWFMRIHFARHRRQILSLIR